MWNPTPAPTPTVPAQAKSTETWPQTQTTPTTQDSATSSAAYYNQMTSEQYKQWETYYQQYAAWYAQYGEEYAKMQNTTVTPPSALTYPQAGATSAYPQPPATNAYPQPPTSAYPQPPAPSAYPQPPAPSAYPQPPAPSAYPQPPGPMAYPQPPAPSSYPQPPMSGYPQPPTSTAYPQPPTSSAYPQPPAASVYPQVPTSNPYSQPPPTYYQQPPPMSTQNPPPPPPEDNSSQANGAGYVAARAAPVTYQAPPPNSQGQQQYQQNQGSYGNNVQNKWNHNKQEHHYGGNRNNNSNNRYSNDNNYQGRRSHGNSNQPPLPNQPPPEGPSDEEKYFDEQFRKWEEEFNCWKKQNANHPDKQAYANYEKKFLEVRTKLLERREQMRRKSKNALSTNFPVKREPFEEQTQHKDISAIVDPITNKDDGPLNAASIFLSNNSNTTIPGLDFEMKQEPDDSETNRYETPTKEKSHVKPLLDLSQNIKNAPQSNDLAHQLDLLLENPQVSALLTLVNLTNAHPNSIQLNALKPIIDALKQLTGRNQNEIVIALAKVSMKLNNREFEAEQFEQKPVVQNPNVHVAASGITVMPPLNQPESREPFQNDYMRPPPLMSLNFDQPWPEFGQNERDQRNQQDKRSSRWSTPTNSNQNAGQNRNQTQSQPKSSQNKSSVQQRMFDMSFNDGPEDNYFEPTEVIDYARMNQPPMFDKSNVVDYSHGNSSNNERFSRRDDFANAKNTIDYGHYPRDDPYDDFPIENSRNNNNNMNDRRSRSASRTERLNYGESNPSYPGKWILISERPPLIRRTKRGKRKNRKGQIIESKKWPKKATTTNQQINVNNNKKNNNQAKNNSKSQQNNKNNGKMNAIPGKPSNVQKTPTNVQNKTPQKEKVPEKPTTGTNSSTVQVVPTYGPYPKTTTLRLHKNIVSLDDILLEPGRDSRPPKIVLILRGPPGSGKTTLARLIRDQENAIGGKAPRILSIDDYYTTEEEEEEIDPVTGKKTMKVVSIYEYEPGKEDNYMQYLMRSLKKNITDNLFDFIIVDAWNDKLHQYFDVHDSATKAGYAAYTIELLYALDVCLDHNVHNRSIADIRNMIVNWKPLPPKHILLDATNLIQFSMNEAMGLNNAESTEQQSTEATPNATDEKKPDPVQPKSDDQKKEDAIDTPMDSIEVDLAAEADKNDDVEEVR
uniref:YLP motif-containing protein 1 n=1 Tax=Culicoides sonorensis TaxID=179676 RepID=A0A336MJY0_CULSO